MELEKLKKVLEEAKLIYNKIPKKEKTFMSVSGYPHYENVCSNILAFYFDPKEEHKLNDLLILSLIKVIKNKDNKVNIDFNNISNNISVQREYITQKGNRIDLVIQSENFVIGIENKIDASVYNDLNDYANTLNKLNDKSIKILLSLHDNTKVVNNTEFVNITYKEFFNQLKKDMNTVQGRNNKWYIFLEEFIKNLENFEGELEMEEEIIKWLKENKNEIEEFDEIREIAYKSIERKQDELKILLKDRIKVDYIKLWKGKNDITCYIDSPLKYHVDAKLTPSGWRIGIFTWTANNNNKVKQIILNSNYNIIEDEANHRWLYEFDYKTSIEEILNKVIEIYDYMENAF